ncbi:MAG: acylneuraminate cytidylyltransferase [Planctomycetota bacterium]|nr:MAG: acylneuraminate cytidylyltransferase [Planctomycetota bacterium]
MGSTRLPGKVLMKIGARTLLERVAERVIRMQSLTDWAVVTSTLAEDDAIAELCALRGWRCLRGSALDVCDRYRMGARELGAEHVVRVTADCPLLGWEEGDRVVDTHLLDGNDYTHNLTCWGSGMPIGTGLEAFRADVLEQAWEHGRAPHHREHVTEWIYEQRARFRFALVQAPSALRRPDYRLTIDHPHDLEFVRRVQLSTVGPANCAPLAAIVECIDRDGGLFQEARRAA